MAEFVMKDMVKKCGREADFNIESAATSNEEIGNDMHYGSRSKLRREGIPFSPHAARRMTASDYNKFDYVVAMDSYNIRNIERIVGEDREGKVYKLLDFTSRRGCDIADPWYTGNFDETYNDITEGCRAFLEKILRDNK